jgi:hypothetical protein
MLLVPTGIALPTVTGMLITEDVPHAFEIFAVSVTVPIAFFVSVV